MASLKFVDVLRVATGHALQDSLRRQMPPGPLRDYFLCGLDTARPEHPQFLRATGIAQLTQLYASLADGLTSDAMMSKVADFLARIIVYQTYEIISDNLGSGLFDAPPDNPPGLPGTPGTPGADRRRSQPSHRPATTRRQLVRSFNTAMTVRLKGAGRSAAVVLAAERPRASQIRALEHGLSAGTHQQLASWLIGGTSATDLQRDLWPALVANIEAGVDVAATVAGTPLGELVRDGLVERYRAVSRTLSARYLSRVELAATGTQSVLVVPTLGYCLAVVTDLTDPVPELAATLTDGTLPELLHGAALLSRLLNDAGTRLLRLDSGARLDALRRLRARTARRGLAAALTGSLFTRLAKDVTHGEFNVCLYGARRAPDRMAVVDALESDLDYFAALYALHRDRLDGQLRRLTARLGDPRPSAMIDRFVRFHTELYTHRYDDAAGEYAC